MSNKKDHHQFTLSEAINAFIKENKFDKNINEATLRSNWEAIMGNVIAKHTTKLFLKEKELHIYINSSIVKNEMLYNKHKAIQLINDWLNQSLIDDIVFH